MAGQGGGLCDPGPVRRLYPGDPWQLHQCCRPALDRDRRPPDRHGLPRVLRARPMSGVLVLGELPGGREIAALVENGSVTDSLWSLSSTAASPEILYKGKIGRPAGGAGALFVDLGSAGQGYLPDRRGVQQGATLLVEATGIPEPGKATPVSPRVLYRQRYTIHTPGNPGINISRAIRDEDERARLAGIVETHIAELENWLGRIGASREPSEAERVRRMVEALRDGGTILRSAARGELPERIIAD